MSGNEPKIISKLVAMTPREVYLQRVKATFDSMKFKAQGQEYLPPSFGGLFGQQTIISTPTVLEVIEFESKK